MTKTEFDDFFSKVLEELKATREAGQKEYAHGEVDNVFNNFIRVSNDTGVTKEQVLYVYLAKHIDGIKAHLKGHQSQREPVQGRIKDCIVYLMLLWGMVEEEIADTQPQSSYRNMTDEERRIYQEKTARLMANIHA